MGISTHYYTIHGIKTEWNSAFSDLLDEVYDEVVTPFVLMDLMGGEYMIFGVALFDSGDLRWGEEKDTFIEIDPKSFTKLEKKYKKEFIAKFPQFAHLMDSKFKLMTITHYS